jgi:hypothetical protein
MRRIIAFVGCLVLTTVVIGTVQAQGLMDNGPGIGSGLWSSVPGFNSISLGNIVVTPSAKVGYENLGLSINFPIPHQAVTVGRLDIDPLDFRIANANLWIGAVVIDARLSPYWSLFLNLEGNGSRNVKVETAESLNLYGHRPREWDGSKLQWWQIDAALGYRLWSSFSFFLGTRWDKTALSLSDPRDNRGRPFAGFDPEVNFFNGDLQIKCFTLYGALVIEGSNFKGTLIYSPLVWADVLLPLRTAHNPSGIRLVNEEASYKLKKPGCLLEGIFEYDMNTSSYLALGLWLKGSLVQVRGSGEEDTNAIRITRRRVTNVDEELASGGETSTFSRYVIGGGLSATLSF